MVITDTLRLKRGNITIRYLNQIIEAKLGYVRRHLHFIVLEHAATGVFLSFENAWSAVRSTIEALPANSHTLFGHTVSEGKWNLTAASKTKPHVLDALYTIPEGLQAQGAVAFCIGREVSRAIRLTHYDSSLIVRWQIGDESYNAYEHCAVDQDVPAI